MAEPRKKIVFNYYNDNKKRVQIKSGEKLKLRQWITRLTNLITLHPMERQKNRELLIKAYNIGGLATVSEYASGRVAENNEYQFKELLKEYNVTQELFETIVKLDKLTKEEISDLGYLEDRLIAHVELINQINNK